MNMKGYIKWGGIALLVGLLHAVIFQASLKSKLAEAQREDLAVVEIDLSIMEDSAADSVALVEPEPVVQEVVEPVVEETPPEVVEPPQPTEEEVAELERQEKVQEEHVAMLERIKELQGGASSVG